MSSFYLFQNYLITVSKSFCDIYDEDSMENYIIEMDTTGFDLLFQYCLDDTLQMFQLSIFLDINNSMTLQFQCNVHNTVPFEYQYTLLKKVKCNQSLVHTLKTNILLKESLLLKQKKIEIEKDQVPLVKNEKEQDDKEQNEMEQDDKKQDDKKQDEMEQNEMEQDEIEQDEMKQDEKKHDEKKQDEKKHDEDEVEGEEKEKEKEKEKDEKKKFDWLATVSSRLDGGLIKKYPLYDIRPQP